MVLRTFFRNATSDPQIPTLFIWTRTEPCLTWAGNANSSNRRSLMPCKTAAGLLQVSTTSATAGMLLNHLRVSTGFSFETSLDNIATHTLYSLPNSEGHGACIRLCSGRSYSFHYNSGQNVSRDQIGNLAFCAAVVALSMAKKRICQMFALVLLAAL